MPGRAARQQAAHVVVVDQAAVLAHQARPGSRARTARRTTGSARPARGRRDAARCRPCDRSANPTPRAAKTDARRSPETADRTARQVGQGVHPIALVATERLVAAVAGQDDLEFLRGQLRHAEGRDRRRIGERLVVGVGEVGQQLIASIRTTSSVCCVPNASATVRAYGSSSKPASSKPIEKVRMGWADASAISATTVLESRPPLRNAPTGTSLRSRNRVDVAEQVEQRLPVLVEAAIGLRQVVRHPVALDRRLAAVPGQDAGRWQLLDPVQDRRRRRHVAVVEELGQAVAVDASFERSILDDRLQLGAPRQAAVVEAPVQRLLAEPVTGEDQSAPCARPRGRSRTCRAAR